MVHRGGVLIEMKKEVGSEANEAFSAPKDDHESPDLHFLR